MQNNLGGYIVSSVDDEQLDISRVESAILGEQFTDLVLYKHRRPEAPRVQHPALLVQALLVHELPPFRSMILAGSFTLTSG